MIRLLMLLLIITITMTITLINHINNDDNHNDYNNTNSGNATYSLEIARRQGAGVQAPVDLAGSPAKLLPDPSPNNISNKDA